MTPSLHPSGFSTDVEKHVFFRDLLKETEYKLKSDRGLYALLLVDILQEFADEIRQRHVAPEFLRYDLKLFDCFRHSERYRGALKNDIDRVTCNLSRYEGESLESALVDYMERRLQQYRNTTP
jgi:hypothetical protein